MTVRFYLDHNVHGDIVKGLRERGIDCISAEEDGRAHLSDSQLFDRAIDLGRVMVSNDRDMLAIATSRLARPEQFAGLVRIRQNVMTVGEAVDQLELFAIATTFEEWQYRIEYLPL